MTSLSNMVKGLRQNKGKESDFVSICLADIRTEINSTDGAMKANALLKLSYLSMLGYDMDMGLAVTIEVMASTKFTVRRAAYLAAALAFTQETDIALLVTNIFKKDFLSGNAYEAGTALNCLASVCTPDMATGLIDDLLLLMSSSKPYIRKKVVLTLFRVCQVYPQALIAAFPKLRDALSDQDQSVLTALANTFLEISKFNPRNVLPLVPQLFHLLSNSGNNWMLIKLLKIFQNVAKIEPRVSAKISPTIATLLSATKAKSVELELLRTFVNLEISCGKNQTVGLAAEVYNRLKNFLLATDKNLRALSLEILARMPHSDFYEASGMDAVLGCVEDSDATIRKLALKNLTLVVNSENFQAVATNLMNISKNEKTAKFAADYASAIISLGESGNFSNVKDFAWYFLLLVDIARSSKFGDTKIAKQAEAVILKVKEVRGYALAVCGSLVVSADFARPELCAFSGSVSWIVGELCRRHWADLRAEPGEILTAILKFAEDCK